MKLKRSFGKGWCPCGSGKKYASCCGATPEDDKKSKLALNLTRVITLLGSKNALLDIGSLAITPENQIHEFRLLHLALLILAVPSEKIGKGTDLKQTYKLCEAYDLLYGTSWSARELDLSFIPYLAWFNSLGRGFRLLSGTLAEPELYFQESLHRVFPIDAFLQSHFGFSFTTFLAMFVQKSHDFINESGLDSFDQTSSGDWNKSMTFSMAKLTRLIRQKLEQHYVFDKSALSLPQRKLFEFLSKEVGTYEPDADKLVIGQSDIHHYPVIDCGDQFVVPFPQLLFPAMCNRSWDVLKNNDSAIQEYTQASRNRLFHLLLQKFGKEAVLATSVSNHESIADFVVLFDQKVLLFFLADVHLSDAEGRAERAEKVWNSKKENGSLEIDSINRSVTIPNLNHVDLMSFIIVAPQMDADTMQATICTSDKFVEIFSFREFEYLIKSTTSELDFIKFFRARERLHSNFEFVVGGDILDSFALYQDTGTIIQGSTNESMQTAAIDPSAFSRKHLESVREFRRKHTIYGNEQRFLRKHYPGAWRGLDKDLNQFFAFDYQNIEVTMFASSPKGSDSLLQAWHVSCEALSYHIGTRREEIEQRIQKVLPRIKNVLVTVKGTSVGPSMKINASTEAPTATVEITLTEDIAILFMRGNNDGERALINGTLDSLGLISTNMQDPLFLPCKKQRSTQLFPYHVPHSSFSGDIEAIPFYKADHRLVERKESSALAAAGICPGEWNSKDDMMRVLSIAFNAVLAEFRTRIAEIHYEELVQLAYRQLEAAYIQSEHAKIQLAIGAQTAEFVDVEEQYSEVSRDAINLSFAIRMILETTLQISSKGMRHVSEEAYTELLALAHRLVELDFEGDMICMLGPNNLSNIGLELTRNGTLQTTGGMNLASAPSEHIFQGQKKSLATPEANQNSSTHTDFPKAKFLNSFNGPFLDVYGYSLSDRIEIQQTLLSRFEERESPIIFEERSCAVNEISKQTKKSKALVDLVVADITLTKDHLSQLQMISPSSAYWRDARILNRPIIQLGLEILYTRTVLEMSLDVFLRRLAAGRYVPERANAEILTNEIGKWRNFAGEHFRTKIVRTFEEFGFNAFPEVKSLNGVTIPKEGISDIDIIAIDNGGRLVLVVECKDINMSKNPKDLRNEAFNFFLNDKELSYAKRTLNKWNWVIENKIHLFHEYNLSSSESWNIEPLLVTSDFLWSGSLIKTDLTIRSEQELLEWLASRA